MTIQQSDLRSSTKYRQDPAEPHIVQKQFRHGGRWEPYLLCVDATDARLTVLRLGVTDEERKATSGGTYEQN